MYIRKKTFVLLLTYLLAALIALGVYTAAHFSLESGYRRTARQGYELAFEETVLSADRLAQELHRACYAAGGAYSAEVCADIYASSLSEIMTVAALPFSTQELERTAEFAAKSGDYARSLLKSAAEGGLDDAARENFAMLYKTAAELAESLRELQNDVNDGAVFLDFPENKFASPDKTVSEAMLALEAGMDETVIDGYAGKYSAAAAVCDGESTVSEREALIIAAEFFGLDPEQLSLRCTAKNGTRCFSFDGGDICVDGCGRVVSLSSERAVAGDMSDAELLERAREFLALRGFEDMHLVSSERSGGVLALELECTENGVRRVGDCIKISFAADDGQVYSYDASGHLARHGLTAADSCAMTEAEARAALPGNLRVRSVGRCYAMLDGGESELCYEFSCLGIDDEPVTALVSPNIFSITLLP